MPRLLGYRDRIHQPLWNTLILRWDGCDRVERLLGREIDAIEYKAVLAFTGRHTLDAWEIMLDFGLPVDPTPIYHGPVVRF